MENVAFYNKHYITVDDQYRIVDGWSDGPNQGKKITNAICINENGGYQFRLFNDGEENPSLRTFDGIPRYKWDGTQAVERTEEELEADRAARPVPEPTEQEQLRADVDFLLAMGGML